MKELFIQGGLIMWPILILSLITFTVTIERIIFIIRELTRRRPEIVSNMLSLVEKGDAEGAIQAASQGGKDFVVNTLRYALEHRETSFSEAFLQASAKELKRFSRGITVLDTAITLAPLLGLLGTVTGMMHSFGLLQGSELGAPAAITGGIAEALIATAFGLGVAIVALLPFNYLNARLEEARHELQDAATHVEIWLRRNETVGGPL